MIEVALGFDTSCYTTSVAAVDAEGEVRCFQRKLLPVAEGQRGLRQSEAVFAHVRQLPELMTQMDLDGFKICAVAASSRPRDAEDSYMPVFTVGYGQARTLACALKVPCFSVSHQQGHIAAGQIGNPLLDKPFVALHISGGTTELLLVEENHIRLMGGTLDLHAGQLVDRIGVAMGEGFPAGPALEKLAFGGTAEALLPVSMEQGDLCCHLSGAETQALRWLDQHRYSNERIAAEVFDFLARTVARLLEAACHEAGVKQALVVGGVASSSLLHGLLQQRLRKRDASLQVSFGQPRYSADNAVGVAWLGMQQYKSQK